MLVLAIPLYGSVKPEMTKVLCYEAKPAIYPGKYLNAKSDSMAGKSKKEEGSGSY
jgi:hypothetical protein